MFSEPAISRLVERHSRTFKRLIDLRSALSQRFTGLDDAIEALVLAVASGETLLLVGPPGTAKSRLIRAFCDFAGLLGEGVEHRAYFEYLLTQFTEPGELFGFFDLPALLGDPATKTKPVLRREDTGMMQHARVVFLDEVFNASSAILNTLLAFMNERRFHDRGKSVPVKLECLFAATNDTPSAPELRAIFDRFLLRVWVDDVPARTDPIGQLLESGWLETHAPLATTSFAGILDDVREFQWDVDDLTYKQMLKIDQRSTLMPILAQKVEYVRKRGLSRMSNRRLVRFANVMLANAVLRQVKNEQNGSKAPAAIVAEDLDLLFRFGTDVELERDDLRQLELLKESRP